MRQMNKMFQVTEANIGQVVEYIDVDDMVDDALITAVNSPQCISPAFVQTDKQDNWGFKLWRATAIMHQDLKQGRVNFWRFAA